MHGLLDRGVAIAPGAYEIFFPSLAHTLADLERTVEIRKQPHSVMQAINRQLTHYAYHVGQIVFLSKHFAAAQWTTLTMPRKKPQA